VLLYRTASGIILRSTTPFPTLIHPLQKQQTENRKIDIDYKKQTDIEEKISLDDITDVIQINEENIVVQSTGFKMCIKLWRGILLIFTDSDNLYNLYYLILAILAFKYEWIFSIMLLDII
jgi:hypothetical protein